MAAAPSFRRGEVIARRYQVVTKSGETALWVGYHAVDQGSVSHPATEPQRGAIPEPDVLVKVIKPDLCPEPAMREKLVRDLQRMRGLQHPGMPRLNEVQLLEEHNTVVLIEAIQAGLSQGVLLRRMATFRQKERFPLAEVRQYGAQLASALSYIHGQMLCHGDLRLESVLLRPDGAKLCDIGLGAMLPRSTYLEAVKKVGEFDLLAPEVQAGRPPDSRADVYGLAALYRHLLSIGQGNGWDALIAEKPAMAVVLTRGMHEDPTQRYSSIEALIADIEAVALTGAPIRRRLAQTPIAMAVAAGRLPVEELSRPVEELVPESARSRRNNGILEVGAVLVPLSGSTSAKISIGTLPPQLGGGGPSSARSGRILDGTANDANSLRETRGPTSATSRGPTSATSRGPASGVSRGGERPSSYSLPPVAEAGEAIKSSARSKDGEAALTSTIPPVSASPAATAAKEPAAAEPSTAVPTGIAGPSDETTPYLKNRPLRETIPPAPLAVPVVDPSLKAAAAAELGHKATAAEPGHKAAAAELGHKAAADPGHKAAAAAASAADSGVKPIPPELAGEESRSGLRKLGEKGAEHKSEPIPRRQSHEPGKGEGREPSSSRSTSSTPRPRGEHASQRSRSGDSGGRQSAATMSLSSKALITSRLALVGALGLAALIGALIAVVAILLIRPVVLCGPAALPQPMAVVPECPPVKECPPAPAPGEPVKVVSPPVQSAPVVPFETPPPSAPAIAPGAATTPPRAAPPLRLAGPAAVPSEAASAPPSPGPPGAGPPPSATGTPRPAAPPPVREKSSAP